MPLCFEQTSRSASASAAESLRVRCRLTAAFCLRILTAACRPLKRGFRGTPVTLSSGGFALAEKRGRELITAFGTYHLGGSMLMSQVSSHRLYSFLFTLLQTLAHLPLAVVEHLSPLSTLTLSLLLTNASSKLQSHLSV